MFNLNLILNDAPQPWQIGFQDSAAPGFSGIVELHNTLIILFIIYLFFFYSKYNNFNLFKFSLMLMNNNNLPPLGNFQSNKPAPGAGGNEVSQGDLDSIEALINKVNDINLNLGTRLFYLDRIVDSVDTLVGVYSIPVEDLNLNNIQDINLFNHLRDRLITEAGIDIEPNQPLPPQEEQLNQLPPFDPPRPEGPGGSGNNGSMLFLPDSTASQPGGNTAGPTAGGNNNYGLIDKIIFNLLIIFDYCVEIITTYFDHFINF